MADTKARGHHAVVKTQAVTSRGWDYMIARMERACLGVYHTMVYLGNTFQEAFPRGRSAVSRLLLLCPPRRRPARGIVVQRIALSLQSSGRWRLAERFGSTCSSRTQSMSAESCAPLPCLPAKMGMLYACADHPFGCVR